MKGAEATGSDDAGPAGDEESLDLPAADGGVVGAKGNRAISRRFRQIYFSHRTRVKDIERTLGIQAEASAGEF